jgi:hypothetical protein
VTLHVQVPSQDSHFTLLALTPHAWPLLLFLLTLNVCSANPLRLQSLASSWWHTQTPSYCPMCWTSLQGQGHCTCSARIQHPCFSFFLFSLSDTGVWTQGLKLAIQVPYHLSHALVSHPCCMTLQTGCCPPLLAYRGIIDFLYSLLFFKLFPVMPIIIKGFANFINPPTLHLSSNSHQMPSTVCTYLDTMTCIVPPSLHPTWQPIPSTRQLQSPWQLAKAPVWMLGHGGRIPTSPTATSTFLSCS